MRFRALVPIVAALSVAALSVAGCNTGGSSATGSASPSASTVTPWMIDATASATPSPTATTPAAVAPSPSGSWPPFGPSSAACTIPWPDYYDGQVMIPLIVTPGKGTLKVQWPSRYGSSYRVTAVNQILVTGAQPLPTWVTVAQSSTCTTTATLTGLTSGNPYIVWLDAPNTARRVDGSRDLYTGRSPVVVPL